MGWPITPPLYPLGGGSKRPKDKPCGYENWKDDVKIDYLTEKRVEELRKADVLLSEAQTEEIRYRSTLKVVKENELLEAKREAFRRERE